MQLSQDEFQKLVRDALARLHEPAALQAHALREILSGDSRDSARRGVSSLSQRLLATIEDLNPGPRVSSNAKSWRPYRVLQLRYVEELNPTEVQHRLGLSKSQYYREHEAALATLAALLWRQRSDSSPTAPPQSLAAPVAAQRSATSRIRRRWVVVAGGLGLAVVLALYGGNRLWTAGQVTASDKTAVEQRSTYAGAPTPTLRVYAGTGQAGYENGSALLARFSGPFGLSIDDGGIVYVADTGNHRIRKIISSGLVLDVAGAGTAGYADGPSATAQFSSPNAVTVAPDGTVYVGDAGNLRVRAISPSGVVSTLAGSGASGYVDGLGTAASFTATGAVVADRTGNLYMPDRSSNVIRKVTPAGVVSTYAGSGIRGHVDGPKERAQFDSPQRMGGVDGTGNVYVLDTGDNRIRKIGPDGTVTTVAGTGVPGFADGPAAQALFSTDIQGLCVDGPGNLYVMDAGNRRVRKVTSDGTVSTLFEFTNPDQSPGNIKIDRAGNLYLSDRDHNVVYKLTVRLGP